MSYDYADEVALALELIPEFGRAVDFVTTSSGGGEAFDPGSGSESIEPVRVLQTQNEEREEGSLVPEHTRRYLADSSVVPPIDGKVRDYDGEYSITGVKPIRPGGVLIAYHVYVGG